MEEIDLSEHGWTLPQGWALWPAERYDGQPADLKGVYVVQGCTVIISADLRSPIGGPTEVRVLGHVPVADRDGITLDVLRAVPLGDARRVLAEWLPRLRAVYVPEEAPQALPERVESPRDYALVAAEYVRLVNAGERRPIHVMAEASGISRNTISARVRRARNMGLLMQMHSGAQLSAELTSAARELLG